MSPLVFYIALYAALCFHGTTLMRFRDPQLLGIKYNEILKQRIRIIITILLSPLYLPYFLSIVAAMVFVTIVGCPLEWLITGDVDLCGRFMAWGLGFYNYCKYEGYEPNNTEIFREDIDSYE